MFDALPSRAQLDAEIDHARCMARRCAAVGDDEARLAWVAVANDLCDQFDDLAPEVAA